MKLLRAILWVPYWLGRFVLAVAAIILVVVSLLLCRAVWAAGIFLGEERSRPYRAFEYAVAVWVNWLGAAVDGWDCDVEPRP
jgi:NhaP-type Na+/H+ or K+/H+ antiporter